jgi:hypothetical protein
VGGLDRRVGGVVVHAKRGRRGGAGSGRAGRRESALRRAWGKLTAAGLDVGGDGGAGGRRKGEAPKGEGWRANAAKLA